MAGYIGPAPVPQATQNREAFTATSNQTSFATKGYKPGFVDVYLNGVKLAAADYTATNGSDVVLASGAVVNDILEIVAFQEFTVADQVFTGDITFTGANYNLVWDASDDALEFADNAKAVFGTGSDLTIYHDGSRSIIQDNGTGNLRIQANNLELNNADNSENYIFAAADGAVTLYHNNSERVATTSYGTEVTATDGGVAAVRIRRTDVTNSDVDLRTGGGSDGKAFDIHVNQASRMRIDSSGNVGIANTAPSSQTAGAQNLVVGASGSTGITILSGSSASNGSIFFADGTSGNEGFRGFLQYTHEASGVSDYFTIGTAGSERVHIDSSGNVGINQPSPVSKLNVTSTAHDNGPVFESTGTTQLWLRDTDVGTDSQRNWGFQSSGGTLNIVRANNDRASGFVTPIYIEQAPANSLLINSSGHVLFGKTADDNTTVGTVIHDNGFMSIARSANVAMILDRSSSDGDILRFTKAGTEVGNIGTDSTDIYIGTGDTGIRFNDAVDGVLPYNLSTGQTDGTLDLGFTSVRWNKLFVAGGVSFQASSASFVDANYLDDYEEGTFTPVYQPASGSLTVTHDSQVGRYTKIGNVVYIRIHLGTDAVSGGSVSINCEIGGLPFATDSNTNVSGDVGLVYSWGSDTNKPVNWYADANQTELILYKDSNDGTPTRTGDLATGTNSNRLWLQGFYHITT